MEGSRVACRRRVSVTSVLGSKRLDKFRGKSGEKPASMEMKWDLNV